MSRSRGQTTFKPGMPALVLICFVIPVPLAQSRNSDRSKAEQESEIDPLVEGGSQ